MIISIFLFCHFLLLINLLNCQNVQTIYYFSWLNHARNHLFSRMSQYSNITEAFCPTSSSGRLKFLLKESVSSGICCLWYASFIVLSSFKPITLSTFFFILSPLSFGVSVTHFVVGVLMLMEACCSHAQHWIVSFELEGTLFRFVTHLHLHYPNIFVPAFSFRLVIFTASIF